MHDSSSYCFPVFTVQCFSTSLSRPTKLFKNWGILNMLQLLWLVVRIAHCQLSLPSYGKQDDDYLHLSRYSLLSVKNWRWKNITVTLYCAQYIRSVIFCSYECISDENISWVFQIDIVLNTFICRIWNACKHHLLSSLL